MADLHMQWNAHAWNTSTCPWPKLYHAIFDTSALHYCCYKIIKLLHSPACVSDGQNPLYTLLNPKSDPCCNSKCFFLPTLWCVRCPTDGFHIWIMQWIGIIDINRVLQNYNSSILSSNFQEMHPKSNGTNQIANQ